MLAMLTLLPAHGGQVHYEKAALDEVVGRSPLIVVVEAASPHTREWKLPIPKSKDVEPFTFHAQRLTVVDVVHDPNGTTQKGAVLEVASGSLSKRRGVALS